MRFSSRLTVSYRWAFFLWALLHHTCGRRWVDLLAVFDLYLTCILPVCFPRKYKRVKTRTCRSRRRYRTRWGVCSVKLSTSSRLYSILSWQTVLSALITKLDAIRLDDWSLFCHFVLSLVRSGGLSVKTCFVSFRCSDVLFFLSIFFMKYFWNILNVTMIMGNIIGAGISKKNKNSEPAVFFRSLIQPRNLEFHINLSPDTGSLSLLFNVT